MKKGILVILLLLSLGGVLFAQDSAQDKLGLGLRRLVAAPERAPSFLAKQVKGGRVRVLVQGDGAAEAVSSCGGFVNTSAAGWITAELPLARVLEAAAHESVTFMRLGRKIRKLNDRGSVSVGANRVWSGESPLAGPYTGEGVVVGVIDTGIDWVHGDFQNDDGTTRLLSVWDQMNDGPHPAGFSYGTEWAADDINSGACTHADTDGHGTHVTGSAAGNGRASGNYSGMAPDADIIVVALDFSSSTGLVDAANYIYSRAEALGKPCVINASLGWHQGPHDGSDGETALLDALIAQDSNRFFCAAAGNEGGDYIHVGYPHSADPLFTWFSPGADEVILLYVRVPNAFLNTVEFSVGMDESTYDPYEGTGAAWGSFGQTDYFTAQDVINGGGLLEEMTYGGITRGWLEVQAETPSDSITGLLFYIEDDMTFNENDWTFEDMELWRLWVRNGNSRIHTWIADVGMPYMPFDTETDYADPDNRYSVGMPATGRNILAVGASVNRDSYTDYEGTTWGYGETVGDLASFSSLGPSADGRIKPEIVTPGHGIISSLSYDAWAIGEEITPDMVISGEEHAIFSGTSMASPMAAGCVALFMDAFPDATRDQIFNAMKGAAVQDGFTGTNLPNNDWGWGKMDVFDMMTTSPVEGDGVAPVGFSLHANAPNPFNPETVIRFDLDRPGKVRLAVFDALGREVAVLKEGAMAAGPHAIHVDGSDWASGVYVCRLVQGERMVSSKMVLLK